MHKNIVIVHDLEGNRGVGKLLDMNINQYYEQLQGPRPKDFQLTPR